MDDPSAWARRLHARLPGKLREIPVDLVAPIAGAILLVAVVQFVLAGRYTVGGFVAVLTGSLVSFLFLFFMGRSMGARAWPAHGARLARPLLRALAKRAQHDLVLTGRSDFPLTTRRMLYEATAFIVSLQVLLVLVVVPLVPDPFGRYATVATFIGTLYAAVLLVPHWAFAKLGLRRVDQAKFTVVPVTRIYSDRLKLSNGALILLVLGAGGFILRRQGLTDVEATVRIVDSLVVAVLGTLIAAAAAVAFHQRAFGKVLDAVARDAIALGARDGRGESNEDLARKLRPLT